MKPLGKERQANEKTERIETINKFLRIRNVDFTLSQDSSLSLKQIRIVFSNLFSSLNYNPPIDRFEEDLPLLLELLNSPVKISPSVLLETNSPNSIPIIFDAMHWLAQQALKYADENTARYSWTSSLNEMDVPKEDLPKLWEISLALEDCFIAKEALEKEKKLLDEKQGDFKKLKAENELLRRDAEALGIELPNPEIDLNSIEKCLDSDAVDGKLEELRSLLNECQKYLKSIKDSFPCAFHALGLDVDSDYELTTAEKCPSAETLLGMAVSYKTLLGSACLDELVDSLSNSRLAVFNHYISRQQETRESIEKKKIALTELQSQMAMLKKDCDALEKQLEGLKSTHENQENI